MEEVPELEEGVKEEENGEEAEPEVEADLPEYPESFPELQAPLILDPEPKERIADITIELTDDSLPPLDDSQPPLDDSIPNAQPDPEEPVTPPRKETAACCFLSCVSCVTPPEVQGSITKTATRRSCSCWRSPQRPSRCRGSERLGREGKWGGSDTDSMKCVLMFSWADALFGCALGSVKQGPNSLCGGSLAEDSYVQARMDMKQLVVWVPLSATARFSSFLGRPCKDSKTMKRGSESRRAVQRSGEDQAKTCLLGPCAGRPLRVTTESKSKAGKHKTGGNSSHIR